MRRRVTVADRLARHDQPVSVLERVDGGRPDAARGRGAGDDDGVAPGGRQQAADSVVPKKAEAKTFVRTGSPSTGAIRGSISTHSLPGSSTSSAGTFSMKTAAASLPKSS